MIESRAMSCSRALQLSLLMCAVCEAHRAPTSPGDPSPPRDPGEVPASHLRMLSQSLAHLLQEAEESANQMEDQEQQIVEELGLVAMTLGSLREDCGQTARVHGQVREEAQALSARGDALWRSARDLQRGLGALETERGAMQRRVSQVLLKIQSAAAGAARTALEKQTQQLDTLTSEVSAQGGAIEKQLADISRLETQVSGAPPPQHGG